MYLKSAFTFLKLSRKFFIGLCLITLSLYGHTQVLGPGDIVFITPSIKGDDLLNVFDDSGIFKKNDDGFTITVPIKNEDGEIENQEFGYSEQDDIRKFTIPGKGDLTVIKDENGDYNFELTPDQIKNANNITCKVDISGVGNCTISPFVKMVGSKLLTADQLVVGYKEGENLKVIGGTATNLRLTDKDSSTGFNKSEIDTGDAIVELAFSKQSETKKSNSNLSLSNFFNNIVTPQSDILNAPDEAKNADFYQISLDTSKLVETVTNPNDRSQSATRLAVKDGQGANLKVTMMNGEQSNLNISMETKGGLYYNPKPFDKNTIVIDTTAPVKLNYNLDGNSDGARSSLSLVMPDKDLSGNTSELSILDTTDKDRTDTYKVTGGIGLNFSGASILDPKTGKNTIDPNSPLAFEIVSNNKIERNRVEKDKTSDLEVVGLKAQGTVVDGNLNGSAVADSLGMKVSSHGVLKKEITATDGIQYIVTEDDQVKKQSALVGKAYYNNGKMRGHFNDGVFIDITDYKNINTAEMIDGKAVKRKAYASGQNGAVEDRDNVISISEGFLFQEVSFYDGSKKMSYLGETGILNSKDHNVKLEDSFYVQTNLDSNGEIINTRVQANSVDGKSKKNGDEFSVFNTDNYFEKIGTTKTGKDILSISHTSDGIKYAKGDGDQVASLKNLQVGVVDADTVKYGTIKLDEANAKKGLLADGSFSENIKITNIDAAFYVDDSDQNNKYRNGIIDLGKIQASGADYSMEIVAKDSDLNDSKFTIVFLEDGPVKYYKIFAEDGQLIHIKGQKQGKELPNTVFQSLQYFESDTFKSAIGTQMAGTLITITPEDNKLQTFNFARVEGVQSINGDYKQLSLTDGSISEFDYQKNRNTSVDFSSISYLKDTNDDGTYQSGNINNANLKYNDSKGAANILLEQASATEFIGKDGKILKNVNLNSSSLTSSRTEDKSDIKNFVLDASQVDSVKFGTVTMDEVTHEKGLLADGAFSEKIKITDLSAAFYIDDSDPTNKFRNGLLDMGELNVVGADYSVDVIAEGGKFSIYFLEDGPNKTYKIFSEDGSLIHIKGQKEGDALPKILFKELSYFESDTFKRLVGLEISGTLDSDDSGITKHQEFSIARVEGYETWDGALKQYTLNNGKLSQSEDGKEGDFTFEKMQFTEQNNIDLKDVYGEITNAAIDYKEIKADGTGNKVEASLSVGHAIGREITAANGDKIKILKVKDLNFVAVDFEEMKKISGKVGDISLYEDKNIQSIDIRDLKDFTYEDLASGAVGKAGAERILRVVEKDDNGEEISSYLLINKAFLNYTDIKKGLNADIKIGVLEFMQDKLNKQNIIMKADIKGRITLTKSIGGEVSFELVGTNMIPGSDKFKSADGTRTKNSIYMNTVGDDGRIDKLNILVGPSFKKDLFSVKVNGGKTGAESLNISIEQDKKEGTVDLVGELKGGEQLKIKALGIAKWDGTEIDQTWTFKGQNLTNYIGIWNEVISTQKVNDYLGLSPGGAIKISSGEFGGYGVELIYVDEDNLSFKEDPNFNTGADQAKSLGFGFTKTNDQGDKSSAGFALTGDSEIDIRTKKGKFSLFGVDQGRHSRLPATANIYWKKDYADGDGAYAAVFYGTTSAMVDTEVLSKDAEFYKNGRQAGGAGISLGFSRKLGERTGFKIGAGVNQAESQICATYTSNSMEPIGELVGGVYNILQGRDFINKKTAKYVPKVSSLAEKSEIERLKNEMDELESLYYGARAYDRIVRALKASEDYLLGKIKYEGKNRDRLKVSLKDLKYFAKLEMDKGTVNRFDSIIGKIEEQKILQNPNMSDEDKVRWTILNLRVSMDRLATNYYHTGTTSIYTDFNKKYQRLIKLGGNTTHLRYRKSE